MRFEQEARDGEDRIGSTGPHRTRVHRGGTLQVLTVPRATRWSRTRRRIAASPAHRRLRSSPWAPEIGETGTAPWPPSEATWRGAAIERTGRPPLSETVMPVWLDERGGRARCDAHRLHSEPVRCDRYDRRMPGAISKGGPDTAFQIGANPFGGSNQGCRPRAGIRRCGDKGRLSGVHRRRRDRYDCRLQNYRTFERSQCSYSTTVITALHDVQLHAGNRHTG